MFKTRTLFVVGAGASCEVNLPMGAELKDIIAKLNIRFEGGQQATGDNQIGQSLRHCGRQDAQFASYLTASRQIAAAMPLALSIDNFIDAHKHNQHIELCGKLAIVKSILEAERKSKLHMRSNLNARMNFSAVSGSWYEPFFQRLTEGISRANIAGVFNNVSFITFNYDRCIEHYLLNALQTYYTIPFEEAGLLVNQLVVHHPYGLVDLLPWQNRTGRGVDFGGNPVDEDDLLRIAREIKTFTERFEEGEELSAIRTQVQDAEVIVFLGFAFADQNMALIKPVGETRARRVFATAWGASVSDRVVIENQIGHLLGRQPYVGGGDDRFPGVRIRVRSDKRCVELFREYWRSLTE